MTATVKRRRSGKPASPRAIQEAREERWKRWRKENAAAIRAYNRLVERYGTFADQLRREK